MELADVDARDKSQVGRRSSCFRGGRINFRRNNTSIGGHTEYFKRATLDAGYSWGTRVNYDAPDALNAFRGDGSELQATLTFRPVSRLKLDEIYYFTRLRTRTDNSSEFRYRQ